MLEAAAAILVGVGRGLHDAVQRHVLEGDDPAHVNSPFVAAGRGAGHDTLCSCPFVSVGRRRSAGGCSASCSNRSAASPPSRSSGASAGSRPRSRRPPSSASGSGVRSSRAGEVDRALADGRLIKTWAMRGSLHLLTPDDGAALLCADRRRPAVAEAGLGCLLPHGRRPVGGLSRGGPRRPGRSNADARGADRRDHGPTGPGTRRRGAPIELGNDAEATGVAGRPLLRPEPRQQGDISPARGREPRLDRPAADRRSRHDRDLDVLRRVRAGHDRRVPALAGRRLGPDPAAGEGARPARSSRSRSTASRRTSSTSTSTSSRPRSRPRPSASWAASMPTCSGRAPRTRTSFRRRGGPRSAARRAGSHRSWSRAASSAEPGASTATACWSTGSGRPVECAGCGARRGGRAAVGDPGSAARRGGGDDLIARSLGLPARSDVHTGPQPGTGVEARGSGGRRSPRVSAPRSLRRAPRHGCGCRVRDRSRS